MLNKKTYAYYRKKVINDPIDEPGMVAVVNTGCPVITIWLPYSLWKCSICRLFNLWNRHINLLLWKV